MAVLSRRLIARLFRRPGSMPQPRPSVRAGAADVEPLEPRQLMASAVVFADGFEGSGSTLPGWSLRT